MAPQLSPRETWAACKCTRPTGLPPREIHRGMCRKYGTAPATRDVRPYPASAKAMDRGRTVNALGAWLTRILANRLRLQSATTRQWVARTTRWTLIKCMTSSSTLKVLRGSTATRRPRRSPRRHPQLPRRPRRASRARGDGAARRRRDRSPLLPLRWRLHPRRGGRRLALFRRCVVLLRWLCLSAALLRESNPHRRGRRQAIRAASSLCRGPPRAAAVPGTWMIGVATSRVLRRAVPVTHEHAALAAVL